MCISGVRAALHQQHVASMRRACQARGARACACMVPLLCACVYVHAMHARLLTAWIASMRMHHTFACHACGSQARAPCMAPALYAVRSMHARVLCARHHGHAHACAPSCMVACMSQWTSAGTEAYTQTPALAPRCITHERAPVVSYISRRELLVLS